MVSMPRPESFDDVLDAYQQAIATRRDLKDRLRIMVGAVARLTDEIAEASKTIVELRADVTKYCAANDASGPILADSKGAA